MNFDSFFDRMEILEAKKQAGLRDAMQERLRRTRKALKIACDGDLEKIRECLRLAEDEMYPYDSE